MQQIVAKFYKKQLIRDKSSSIAIYEQVIQSSPSNSIRGQKHMET